VDVSPSVVGAVSAAIFVPLVLRAIGRTTTYGYTEINEKALKGLAQKYRWWEFGGLLSYVVLVVVFGYLLWVLLCSAGDLQRASLEPAPFVLTPTRIFWAVPAMFFGMFIAALPLVAIGTRVLGPEMYREYMSYQNAKYRMDSEKVTKHMAYAIVPAMAVYCVLLLNNYAKFSEDNFIINPFFGLTQRAYDWSAVRELKLIKSFKAPVGTIIRHSPYFVIAMNDGTSLNFHRTTLELRFEDQQALASFVAQKADLGIDVVDPYP